MKKLFSISFLFVLCVFTFTFKTHYCFHHETHERYHGDCQVHIKEAVCKGVLGEQNIFPVYYYCLDVIKDAQAQETKYFPIKNHSFSALIIPPVLKIQLPDFSFLDWNIPEPQCRSATLLPLNLLRGPPSFA